MFAASRIWPYVRQGITRTANLAHRQEGIGGVMGGADRWSRCRVQAGPSRAPQRTTAHRSLQNRDPQLASLICPISLPTARAGGSGGSEDEEDFGSGEAAVVKGFRLDVLAARRPQLRQELLTFRDQLLAADDEETAVKVGTRACVWGLNVEPRVWV